MTFCGLQIYFIWCTLTFRRINCLNLQGNSGKSAMKMVTLISSETLVPTYQTAKKSTCWHNPDDNIDIPRCDILKSVSEW